MLELVYLCFLISHAYSSRGIAFLICVSYLLFVIDWLISLLYLLSIVVNYPNVLFMFLDFSWQCIFFRLEENEKLVLTPFEKNLDIWRQLWRVVERTDLVRP